MRYQSKSGKYTPHVPLLGESVIIEGDTARYVTRPERRLYEGKPETVTLDAADARRSEIAGRSWYVKIRRKHRSVECTGQGRLGNTILGLGHEWEVVVDGPDPLDYRRCNLRPVRIPGQHSLADGLLEMRDGYARCRVFDNLGNEHETLLDVEDYERLADRRFTVYQLGNFLYAGQLHRDVMGQPKGLVVDHIDGNSLDNRKANLRVCKIIENLRNRQFLHPKNKTGVNGVHRVYQGPDVGKYEARIGREVIGIFDTLPDAAAARRKVEVERWGTFAPKAPPRKRRSAGGSK